MTQISLLAKNLAVMLKSGMPITEALSVAAESSGEKMKRILQEILSSVRAGRTLADSLARYKKVFPQIFISSVYAGEISGNLDVNLESVSANLEKERNLRSKIKGAMTYPTLVLAATVLLGAMLSFVVLPKITPMFDNLNVDLPGTTKALIAFSELIQKSGVLVAGVALFLVAAIFWLARRSFVKPVTHWVLLKIPYLGNISRGTNLARFTRTLATLLKSGLSIDEALGITARVVSNYYYQRALTEIAQSVSQGSNVSKNLLPYGKLFPLVVSRMIKVGEESGGLEETLFYLADYYEVEVDTSVKSFSTVIEPVLLLIIGAAVAFLGLSIITPMYEITSGIR